ncbi:MAG: Abi family protein [Spiroplasma sp.]|nr:Abi family protein [Spiroplasma sp.]
MALSETWLVENLVDEKYLGQLKKSYPNHDLDWLLLLNVDLRLLYLKHIFMIENSLKKILLRQLSMSDLQNLDGNHYLNQEHLKNLRAARRIIRSGYYKYSHNGVLKSKTLRSLFEVMSFESILSLLETLNIDALNKITDYFGIHDFNKQQILFEQLNYIKDIRNYLSHNFKVLGIHFIQKGNNNYYQQDLQADNDHHYLHLLIDRFSSKSQILPSFNDDYQKLFNRYNINNFNFTNNHNNTE